MQLVKLGDVVKRVKDSVNKDTCGLENYIGGEHFDSERLLVTRFGSIKGSKIGPAFNSRFVPDDVLLMSRNPHLKKAGMVNFEGVCSDVSYVIRTKDENILRQKFIPLLFQSDAFWNFAEKNKKGSTNFFLNWSDFERFEFNLLDTKDQDELCDILWTINSCIEEYNEFITLSEKVKKAEFVKLFKNHNYSIIKIGSVLQQVQKIEKVINPTSEKYVTVALYGKGVRERNIEIHDPKPFSGYRVKEGQFIYSRIDARNGAFGIIPKELNAAVVSKDFPVFDIDTSKILKDILMYSVLEENFIQQINKNSLGTTNRQRIKEDVLLNYSIILPPMNVQEEFKTIINKIDEAVAITIRKRDQLKNVFQKISKEKLFIREDD